MFIAFVDTILGILELVVLLVLAQKLLVNAAYKLDDKLDAVVEFRKNNEEKRKNGDDTK